MTVIFRVLMAVVPAASLQVRSMDTGRKVYDLLIFIDMPIVKEERQL